VVEVAGEEDDIVVVNMMFDVFEECCQHMFFRGGGKLMVASGNVAVVCDATRQRGRPVYRSDT